MSGSPVDLGKLIPAPLTGVENIQNAIANLQEQLRSGAPGYEALLQKIHVELHKNEEAVALLKPEEIGTLILGLAKKKNIVIAALETKSTRNKTASGKSLKQIGVDEL